MATKTIILRPTSVTSDDDTLVTLYPTDITMMNAHMLVGEEMADDDSTYITGGLGSNIYYHFSYAKPEDLASVTNFSFKIKYRSEGDASGTDYQLCVVSTNYTIGSTGTSNVAAYTYVLENIEDGDMTSIISEFNNETSIWNFYISQRTTKGGSKSKPIRTTQVYVEITYETNQQTLQYLKHNDAWINIGEFKMYYKRNNKWILLNDLDISSYSDKKYFMEVSG